MIPLRETVATGEPAKLVTPGGIAPSAGEIADNPRSASAHLRVAVKLDRGEDG